MIQEHVNDGGVVPGLGDGLQLPQDIVSVKQFAENYTRFLVENWPTYPKLIEEFDIRDILELQTLYSAKANLYNEIARQASPEEFLTKDEAQRLQQKVFEVAKEYVEEAFPRVPGLGTPTSEEWRQIEHVRNTPVEIVNHLGVEGVRRIVESVSE
jgi:hypothetical protein